MLAAILALTGCHRGDGKPPAPKLAMWYWHSPFQLSPDDLSRLKQIGVEELYVRAGTLSTDGDRVSLTLKQKFQPGPSLPIHLVINADPGVLHRFDDLSMPDLAKTIAENYKSATKAATDQGLEVRGLQLDIDVPTRLLSKYAELIRDVRPKLGKQDKLSITSLATWFSSGNLQDVVKQLDFYAPQFYEASVPLNIDEQKPIANLKEFQSGLKAAERIGVPFMIGAPSYGQALLFDQNGKLAGTYRGLSPEDASRHPSLTLENSKTIQGEERLTLRAIKPGTNGKGFGYRIVYRRPTPESIANFYKTALAERPANCIGVALFRVPEAGEALATPLPTLEAALQNQQPKFELKLTSKLTPRTFAVIEAPHGSIETEFQLTLDNRGNADTCLGPTALQVELRFPTGAMEELQAGDFSGANPFADDRNSIGHVSLAHANGAILWRAHLAPGQKVRCGPMLMTGAGRLSVKWSLTDPDGKVTSGELKPIEFGSK